MSLPPAKCANRGVCVVGVEPAVDVLVKREALGSAFIGFRVWGVLRLRRVLTNAFVSASLTVDVSLPHLCLRPRFAGTWNIYSIPRKSFFEIPADDCIILGTLTSPLNPKP